MAGFALARVVHDVEDRHRNHDRRPPRCRTPSLIVPSLLRKPIFSPRLIDDDLGMLRTIDRLLRLNGFDVQTFESAEKCLKGSNPHRLRSSPSAWLLRSAILIDAIRITRTSLEAELVISRNVERPHVTRTRRRRAERPYLALNKDRRQQLPQRLHGGAGRTRTNSQSVMDCG